MPTKKENGKGANFDTRPNPFTNKAPANALRADFTEVPNIGTALQVLCNTGCAVIVGATRDGGALVLTILDGDTRHRTYCSTSAELQDAFNAIIDMYGEG